MRLLFLIIIFSCTSVFGQSRSGSISVRVIDAGNNKLITDGMAEATNRLQKNMRSSLRVWGRALISKNKNPVIIKDLEPGSDYEVHAWGTGAYDEQYKYHVQVLPGQTINIMIYLHRHPMTNGKVQPAPMMLREMKKK
jgi:hypothetical protein